MAYTKQTWFNDPAGGTPLSAARLNHMEEGIDDADIRLTAAETDVAGKVAKAGDTMTGALTLPADPTAALQAATKQYVDAKGGGVLDYTLLSNTTGNTTFGVSGTTWQAFGVNVASSFIVPPSGNVMVELSVGNVSMNSLGYLAMVDSAGNRHAIRRSDTNANGDHFIYRGIVEGLTPGAAETLTLQGKTNGGSYSFSFYYGIDYGQLILTTSEL